MARKKKEKEKSELVEIVEILDESGNWAKVLMKMKWFGGPAQLDIRSVKMDTINDEEPVFGKGITLSDKSLKILTKKLVELGYLDDDNIESYQNGEVDNYNIMDIDLFNMYDDKKEDDKRLVLRIRRKR